MTYPKKLPFNYEAHKYAHDRGEDLGSGTRSETLIVAASDSSDLSKATADYVCLGADDDVTVQQAIDALPSVGGSVRLMEGTYAFSSSLNPVSNLTLEGLGDSTFVTMTGGSDIISATTTVDNLEVRFIRFDPGPGDVLAGTYTDLRVVGCTVEPSDVDGALLTAATLTDAEITGCRFVGGGDAGATIAPAATGLRVGNCYFDGQFRGFYFSDVSTNVLIEGCIFTGITECAIQDNTGSTGVTVTGNSFVGNFNDIFPGAAWMIGDNRFVGTLDDSIQVNAHDVLIEGNRFDACQVQTNNSKDSIRLTASNRCHVAGNLMRYGSGNKPKYGIHIVSGTANEVIDNDLYHAGSTADYLDAGTSSIVEGNRLSASFQGRTPLAGTAVFQAPTTPPVSTTVYQNTSGLDWECSLKATLAVNPLLASDMKVEISPNNFGSAQVWADPGYAAGALAVGADVEYIAFPVPAGWYYKVTSTNATIGVLVAIG